MKSAKAFRKTAPATLAQGRVATNLHSGKNTVTAKGNQQNAIKQGMPVTLHQAMGPFKNDRIKKKKKKKKDSITSTVSVQFRHNFVVYVILSGPSYRW